jgi:hypothetical protein
MEMIQGVTALTLFAAAAIGMAVLVYIPVRSFLSYRSAKSGRAYIALKALASLAAWFIASCGWLYMFFVMAYWTGPFVNIEGETGEAASLLFLDLLYAVIGCGLALWVRHKSYSGVSVLREGAT